MRYFIGVITAALLIGAPAAESAGPPQQIAFNSGDRTSDIYVMNADGTNVQRLTSTGLDSDPTWSPDGSQIAFTSTRSGKDALYVMNADGSNVHRILDMPAVGPQWSRQGRIVFADGDIYTVAPDGTGLTDVTNGAGGAGPSWSADGSQIAYESSLRGISTIFVMNADGSNPHAVGQGVTPAFSPDGKHLAWGTSGPATGGYPELIVANTDGSSPQSIWTAPQGLAATEELYPNWSPDSKTIAFDVYPNAEILSIPATGGSTTQLTTSAATDTHPAWRTAVPSTGLVVTKLRFTQRACATRPGAAAVIVDDAQGRPLANASVVFYGGRVTTTDANGSASVSPAVAKRHKGRLTLMFTARIAGRPTVTKHVSLPACR